MVNKARGEVEVRVGEHKFILCAEMERLAAVSAELGSLPFIEIAQMVAQQEPQAVLACLRHLDITDTFKELEGVNFRDAMSAIEGIIVTLAGGEEMTVSKTKKQEAVTTPKT